MPNKEFIIGDLVIYDRDGITKVPNEPMIILAIEKNDIFVWDICVDQFSEFPRNVLSYYV